MTDLVKRLRDLHRIDVGDLRREAADYIEKMEARMENWRQTIGEQRAEVERLTRERDDLKREIHLAANLALQAEKAPEWSVAIYLPDTPGASLQYLWQGVERLTAEVAALRGSNALLERQLDRYRVVVDNADHDGMAWKDRAEAAEASNLRMLGLLEDAWYQWSLVVTGFDDQNLDAPRMDGCLSTLEDICAMLIEAGRLVKYDKRPDKNWWVRALAASPPKAQEKT